MDAEARLLELGGQPQVDCDAVMALCRELIADQQRLHQRLERISRISDRYQADLRQTNKELESANSRLTEALSQVRTLGGFIPICSRCKRVRDDGGFWDDVEGYLSKNSDVVLSSGCCPTCAAASGSGDPIAITTAEGEDEAEHARLAAILANSAWTEHPLRAEYARLSRDTQKLGRRLHKISRISDGFQSQMKELNLALGRASRTDPLTGLANRRALLERLENESTQASSGHGFAVAMIDVDHFKRINDSFGHAAGDAVLRALATMLMAEVGAHGLVGRWGGEEFLLVLPLSDSLLIADLCEQIRAGAEALAVDHNNLQIRVTLSIGSARHERVLSFEDTIRDADRALYAAKSCGRNRVVAVENL
ncbi:MAG: diguanylate cyclase [Pseudomarimonas sp.]